MTSAGRRLVLGVDGGNSKTDLALVDQDGALLSVVRGPRSSPHELGPDGSVDLLTSMFERAVAEAGLDGRDLPLAATAHVLLAGVDLPEERDVLHERIERMRWSEQLMVDIDVPALLRAGGDRGWGIAIVCGAGINCFGRGPDGPQPLKTQPWTLTCAANVLRSRPTSMPSCAPSPACPPRCSRRCATACWRRASGCGRPWW